MKNKIFTCDKFITEALTFHMFYYILEIRFNIWPSQLPTHIYIWNYKHGRCKNTCMSLKYFTPVIMLKLCSTSMPKIHTQLIRTHFGRLVFGSITLQNAYIIFPLFRSSVISSIPPAGEKNQKRWPHEHTEHITCIPICVNTKDLAYACSECQK